MCGACLVSTPLSSLSIAYLCPYLQEFYLASLCVVLRDGLSMIICNFDVVMRRGNLTVYPLHGLYQKSLLYTFFSLFIHHLALPKYPVNRVILMVLYAVRGQPP